MRTLNLTLKKKWFDMIESGEKKEEYREIKEYWARRLIYVNYPLCLDPFNWDEPLEDMREPTRRHESQAELMRYFGLGFKRIDKIVFRNGYSATARTMEIKLECVRIAQGNPSWGAEPGKYYFALSLGSQL